MSILFAYLFYFIAASASPLQRRWLATRKNQDNKGQVAFAFQVMFVVAVLSLLLPFFSPFRFQGSTITLFLLSLVCGVCGAIFFSTSFIAQKHVEAGISS